MTEKKNSAAPPSFWWETMTEECPITLEPLSSLPYPPFSLGSNNMVNREAVSSHIFYFDGVALASYIVSRGVFQNPLTREPLTWDDCRRLDDYVRQYSADPNNACVCEAYGLRESVRVKQIGDDEASQRRAEALRSEATSALRHLFVFGHHGTGNRGRETNARPPTSESSLTADTRLSRRGFDLHGGFPIDSAVEEMGGLRIIDDDEAHVAQVEREAYKEQQQAFPPLSADMLDTRETAVELDEEFLQHVRKTAAKSQHEEENRRRVLIQARQRMIQEAQRRQEERKRARADQLAKLKTVHRERHAEQEELEQARAEIEKWREQQWDKLRQMAEEENQKIVSRKQSLEPRPQTQQTCETKLDPDAIEDDADADAKRAAKKAAKRRRARERKKVKNEEEQKQTRKQQEQEALEKRKAESSVKCDACGGGVLGPGFEKFNHTFCSPKCARAGPASS